MARIDQGVFRQWRDGERMTADDYAKDREILRTAINDFQGEVDILKTSISAVALDALGTEMAEARGSDVSLSSRLETVDTKLVDVDNLLEEKAKKVDIASTLTFYVSPDGNDVNDGKTSASPFATLQKAFDVIKNVYSVVDGKIKIDLAAGVYEQSATITNVPSKNRIEIVGKKDSNGIPTVIFEGGNNSALPHAMSFMNYMNVLLQDIKVQNFAGSASRNGVVAQMYSNIWTRNVHAANCGFAGINVDAFVRLYVEGGIVENCRIGIRVYSNSVCTIGYNNPTKNVTDPNHTVIKNCTETGVLVYNMSTGHLDFSEIAGNVTGVTIQNSSRLHVWGCLIKDNTLCGVTASTSSTWYNDLNTYQNNAKDFRNLAFSVEISDYDAFSPVTKITPFVLLEKTTLTGSTAETYFNTLNNKMIYTLKGNALIRNGQKLRVTIVGTFAGAGVKTVNLRIAGGLMTGFASVSGSAKNFKMEVDIYAVSGTAQKVLGSWTEGNTAYNALFTDRTISLTSNRDITVTGTLSDAAGSISIESFEVREIV